MSAYWTPERFWAKIDIKGPNECWLWQAATAGKGQHKYGWAWDGREQRCRNAHVIAWELANNKKIQRPFVGLHRCDVPLCCNPRHVKKGTLKQNTQDCIKKGRFKRRKGTVFKYKDGTKTYGFVKL